jgi:uncharacterized membrane protein YdjX (TVP38/TMEM64 family)
MHHLQTIMIKPDRQAPPPYGFRTWLPAGGLALLIAVAYFAGLDHYLSLRAIAENRASLKDFAATHLLSAILLYVTIYIAVVALSLPGAAVLSVVGGFLFGWWLSAPVTVIAATVGAVIVFQIVKTSFGAALARRAGPMVRKLSDGFAKDAFNYLLFLRLVPAFPFFVVNAVAGLSGVALRTFIAATVIGIIPGTIAFAYLGTGLDSIIDAQTDIYRQCVAAKGATNCVLELDAGALATPDIVIAFLALGIVALIPIGLKYWKRKTGHANDL